MKVACSVALIVFSLSLATSLWQQNSFATPIGFATAIVAFAAGLFGLLSTLDRRSSAVLRLDWYLPQIRRPKSGDFTAPRWFGRRLRAMVPASWLSNHQKKQRGRLRKLLKRAGISWLASPPRRLTQASCLVLFLVLFFYVCWPYSAKPVPAGEASTGWSVAEVDQATGEFLFAISDGRAQEINWLQPGADVYVHQSGADVAGMLNVVALDGSALRLAPSEGIPDPIFDALLTSGGQWTVAQTDPYAWPSHYADELASKEWIAAEIFLTIDPLVSLSTAIASRSWVWSLVCAAVILILSIMVPRGFCGYICPLGTTIDLFDWAVTSRTRRFQVPGDGWWVHIKYYLLAGTLVAAVGGILVSGFFSAIPVITRAMLFIAEPLQSGSIRGWHLVPAMNIGHVVSILMFFGVLSLGFMRPRFWCKYVCPSGAVFSIGNLFRVTERKVESSCINCNKCVEICPFDAIKPDFTTRETDCTMCQSCGGVCPTHAIKFVERWNVVELKVLDDPPTNETALGRRGFLSLAAGSAAAVAGGLATSSVVKGLGANVQDPKAFLPVRPPGSVPEQEFLQMCIRCGECFKACPNNVLQPEAFQQGLEGLWTPMVKADWAGCESSCNACGQVCPTGAIRPLPLAEKKVAKMGLAIVNEQTCLPMAGREDCDLCVQECNAAGYEAIEYVQVGTEIDDEGRPIDGSGMLAPAVIGEKCVGCGLCQTRCYGINVKERGVLAASAIVIEAGEGREDRLMSGSYLELRQQEQATIEVKQAVPAEPAQQKPDEDPNPFGL